MIYLLDANSFIQAKNLHYRMNVVPGFWQWLRCPHTHIEIKSIDWVYKELTKSQSNPDKLHRWSVENKDFFANTQSKQEQLLFAGVANHLANHQTYSNIEKERFLSGADPWLIASAKAIGATIVTHEVAVPPDSKKVKIPNVARAFDVECLNVFDLLELAGCRLELDN